MVSIFVFVADEGPVAKGASYYQQAGRERDFEGEDPIMDAYRDNVGFNDDGQQKLLDAARDEMVRERSQILAPRKSCLVSISSHLLSGAFLCRSPKWPFLECTLIQ